MSDIRCTGRRTRGVIGFSDCREGNESRGVGQHFEKLETGQYTRRMMHDERKAKATYDSYTILLPFFWFLHRASTGLCFAYHNERTPTLSDEVIFA